MRQKTEDDSDEFDRKLRMVSPERRAEVMRLMLRASTSKPSHGEHASRFDAATNLVDEIMFPIRISLGCLDIV